MGFDKNMGFQQRLGFKYDVLFFSTFNANVDKIVSVCTANDFEKRITTETLYESYEFANKLSNINQFSNLIEGLKNVAGKK